MIRLTSPNLNYIIGVGAILLYVDVYLTVVPTKDKDTVTVLCNVSMLLLLLTFVVVVKRAIAHLYVLILNIVQMTPWLTSLGYSLCFGTMLVKMARVYYIFNHPHVAKPSKASCVYV